MNFLQTEIIIYLAVIVNNREFFIKKYILMFCGIMITTSTNNLLSCEPKFETEAQIHLNERITSIEGIDAFNKTKIKTLKDELLKLKIPATSITDVNVNFYSENYRSGKYDECHMLNNCLIEYTLSATVKLKDLNEATVASKALRPLNFYLDTTYKESFDCE